MRIGELARRTCVSQRSLRYHEQQRLLVSDRTPGGQREYSERAVDRVVHIQELLAAGPHSTTISTLLPCMRDDDGGPSADATPRLISTLDAERRRLGRAIRELTTAGEVLDDVITTAANEGAGT